MMLIRCPQCHLPVTNDESQAGTCPACEAVLVVEAPIPAVAAKAGSHTPGRGMGLFLWGMMAVLFLGGGFGGYLLGADVLFATDDEAGSPSGVAASKTPQQPRTTEETAKALKRVKDLEALTAKLGQDLDIEKKQTAEAKTEAESARRDADKAGKPQEGRVKELEAITEKLGQDLAAQKKQADEAKDVAEAARREAEKAREGAGKPQDVRVKELELFTKKLQKDLVTHQKKIMEGQGREEAARRNTEKVRQDGQRVLEQVRQVGQRALEQLRQENQRALEQVRQQLRQQEQMTQQARAEAQRQKQAAEEARRKNK